MTITMPDFQSKCCCHGLDRQGCFRSRYSVDPDDWGDDEHDGECECSCHDEYEEWDAEQEAMAECQIEEQRRYS